MILVKQEISKFPLHRNSQEWRKKRYEFYTANPQDLFPNALDTYRKEMIDNNWDFDKTMKNCLN